MKLKDIKLNKNNPRIIKDDKFNKLKKSISEFPKMLELRPMVLDEDNVVLGGNMRLQALKDLQYTEIPDNWVKYAKDLSDEEKQRFIISDNIGFGDWDWDIIANEWDSELLLDWGLDIPNIDGVELSEEYGEDFTLKDGDKAPFQQITFTLADEQANTIQDAIKDIKATDEYKYVETFDNENSNGNAIYLIVRQWAEQKKL